MNKKQISELLQDPAVAKMFLKSKGLEDPKEWLFVPGTFESGKDPDPESQNWFILAIHKYTFDINTEGTYKSNGGAYMISGDRISHGGNAHQHTDGTWLWDTD